jgi:PAS domain S-box-containing protein
VLTRANVNYSENGVPLQFVATNTDITTRIEYKNKIAQSEAKYEKLVGSIHEIIFEIDRDGVITFLNEAWERHLLFKVDKAIGTEVINYIHPEHRTLAQDIASKNYKGNPNDHLITELKFIAANGKAVWMEVHSTILFNSLKEYKGITGTLINIDDRKKMEIARQASENKIARISDNISDIIVEIDEEGKYQFISNGVRNMLGRNPDSFKGESAMKDIHPEDREMVKRNLFDQLMNGASRVVEQYRVLNGDGEYTWIETVVQPLISVTGERTFIAACRDISARRKIQEEIQASLQKEKELNELKSRFITMTSHEFRTPLSSIKSSIELLEMYAEDLGDRFMKPFERHFQKITSQVGRINNLLNNIDTLGKIEAMEMPFSPVNQNFVEFVSNLLKEQVAEEFPDRKVQLSMEGKARNVVFDPSLLENMLLNIIKNALLYSEEDVPSLTITFRADDIHILLKDKGLGIPKDEMNLMFTSFFRAKNIVNLNIPGNGLGLVISKKIVDLHKGTIQLRSEENVGTEVEIILPNLTIE